MDKKIITKALEELKANSPKRKFRQTIDLIITLKGLDLKKPEQQVDLFTNLHFPRVKKVTVCGLVGPELADQSKEAFDNTILLDDFAKLQNNKKEIKKIASKYDFFVAQGNIMAKVAATFGKVFGPRGKMPNPKAGCVVPPNANLKQIAEKLKSTIQLKVKTQPMFQIAVGYEDTKEEILVDNIHTIYTQLVHHLPQEKNNIRTILLKMTMGKPIKVGGK